jgi:Zn-dependent peptidase ImmA (M78 family)/DNA-binding XRE family transcriptional regulator
MNESNNIKVNHLVLRWARETNVLSRAKAAESLNITSGKLEQLEKGKAHPTLDELKAMSKTYKRTIATLLLQQLPEEKPLPGDRRTVNSDEIGVFQIKTILAVRKARALLGSLLELKTEAGLPLSQFQVQASLNDSASMRAESLRNELKLDDVRQLKNVNLALETYIEKIESLGIAIFQLSLTQDKLRGFSITDEKIPIIVLKRGGELPTAKIFTLFHELGHILLKDGGLCDLQSEVNSQEIEKWCNAFAGEILVPQKDLLSMAIVGQHKTNNQKIWTQKELIELGADFHVGPLTILRRLLDNGLTTASFYREKHRSWNNPVFSRSKTPEGRNIPQEAIKEKGKTYVALAFKIYDQNKIDLKDLSDFLGVKLSYITKTRQLLYTVN